MSAHSAAGNCLCSDRRCFLAVNVEYRIERAHKKYVFGRGMTLAISSTEVVFAPESHIPAGVPIEVSLDWAASGKTAVIVRVHIEGETMSCGNGNVEVKIFRHDFRISSGAP